MTADDLVLGTRVTLGMLLPRVSPLTAPDQHYLSPVQTSSWRVKRDTADEGLLGTEDYRTDTEAAWAEEML